jgi:hypothetical protein
MYCMTTWFRLVVEWKLIPFSTFGVRFTCLLRGRDHFQLIVHSSIVIAMLSVSCT